ncbi:hypothetical protein OUZ56_021068 [Daphnia magna]|uniref:Uncharacterized protein n=1 Tax=Daphnia magna TaxID=35525 RepID=A0ABQ9ZHC6_9CRUS|nr:hypothetical protein OUZ56_021068 [Daphnia magna]
MAVSRNYDLLMVEFRRRDQLEKVNICYRFPIELSCHLAADDTNDLTDYTDQRLLSSLVDPRQ